VNARNPSRFGFPSGGSYAPPVDTVTDEEDGRFRRRTGQYGRGGLRLAVELADLMDGFAG
jgi:hypothetical protein